VREFWIRDNKKHFNVSEKMTDHHYACFDHPNIEYPDYHVIEKKEADKLAAAIEQCRIATFKFLSENVDDNHVTWDLFGEIQKIEDEALKDYRGEK